MTRILALIGSLRAESVNRKLAETAVTVAPDGAEVTIHEGLADIPFYNEDADGTGVPAAAVALRAAAADADAILLVTPEYNGTLPAVLKNAIDWLSRPYGAGAVKDKPVAVISASMSEYAGRWARDDAQRSVGIAGGRVVENAALSVGGIGRFADRHPSDDAQVAEQIAVAIRELVDATGRELVTA